ncbi:hypothetical protein BJ912DRAFT_1138041 [Pholiota molesta]|nr:hypothetical protein BJ912DRAFT_1138041 [Pholiota molesta]
MSEGGDHVRGSALALGPAHVTSPPTTTAHVRGHLPPRPRLLLSPLPPSSCRVPLPSNGGCGPAVRFNPAPAPACPQTRRRRGVALPIPTAPTTVNPNADVNDNPNDNTDDDADNDRLQHAAARPSAPVPHPAATTTTNERCSFVCLFIGCHRLLQPLSLRP